MQMNLSCVSCARSCVNTCHLCMCVCDRSNVLCLGTTRLSVSLRNRLSVCSKASSPARLSRCVCVCEAVIIRNVSLHVHNWWFLCVQVMERLCVRLQQQVCTLKGCEEEEEVQTARQILKEARDSRAVSTHSCGATGASLARFLVKQNLHDNLNRIKGSCFGSLLTLAGCSPCFCVCVC